MGPTTLPPRERMRSDGPGDQREICSLETFDQLLCCAYRFLWFWWRLRYLCRYLWCVCTHGAWSGSVTLAEVVEQRPQSVLVAFDAEVSPGQSLEFFTRDCVL